MIVFNKKESYDNNSFNSLLATSKEESNKKLIVKRPTHRIYLTKSNKEFLESIGLQLLKQHE